MQLFQLQLSALVGLALWTSSVSALFPATNATKSAGQQACSQLSKQLGSKVASVAIDPSYIVSTTYYYSEQQAENKPSCVVAPTAYSDVQSAMKTIRQYNSTLAIKAGGHQTNNYWSSVAGGVLIDFKNMKSKSFTPGSTTGYFQPGNRWDDLYQYYAQFGMVPVGGRIGGVGSGLAIGGGLSFLSAEYGLACDQFTQLDVVLPDGSLVTATKDNQYSDLLLAIKGGGNQFGIVVGYTVQVYPQDPEVYGGLLIYGADQIDAVYDQVLNFTNQNTDPKAAVIATLDVIGLPSALDLVTYPVLKGLTTFIILFNVYNGPDGQPAFTQFEKIPHLLDTRKKQPYTAVASMVDIGHFSSGSVSYRAASHNSNTPTSAATLKAAIQNFQDFANTAHGTYDILSFDVQPVAASLVQQSRARGGNAQDSVDGPYYWINYLHSSLPGLYTGVPQALAELKTAVEKTPNNATLPIFLNDANADQPILQSYHAYDKLKAAKAKYDPQNYFSTHMGGPSFTN
ncbi:FAD-binding domain-containing protein [Meira miltonrushii]|uniref:FAD-binding domain-containing protein n=1 Tax=Meira miltonrushii TaxID=1280837 RepID=A0A316V9S0_9BASI|nr:FAD-binding domain-containing protein [Meira miltonrushii]PWN33201.1 FAD-binding domain-containing protein [Meira miltonrushii]